MTERVFGRRGAATSRAEMPAQLVSGAARQRPETSATKHLDASSRRVRLIGEFVAYAVATLAFLALPFWPRDPLALFGPDTLIYIPVVLASAHGLALKASVDPLAFQGQGYGIAGAIALLGILAAFKGRWLPVLLTTIFFCVPWHVFGYDIPFATAPLIGMVFALSLRFVAVRLGWKMIFVMPILVLIAPLAIIGLARSLPDLFPRALPQAADLVVPAGQPSTGTVERIIVLADLKTRNAEEEAIKGYVLAQDYALKRDMAQASAALSTARSGRYQFNAFDTARMEKLSRFLTASGQYGPQRRDAILQSYHTATLVALGLAVIAGILFVCAPFANLVGERMQRRSTRIARAVSELADIEDLRSRRSTDADAAFGREIASSAVFDGEDVVTTIKTRLRVYGRLAAGFFIVSLMFAVGYFRFWLPAADSNSAFSTVALPEDLVGFAAAAGFHLPPPYFEVRSIWPIIPMFLMDSVVVAGLVLAMVKYPRMIVPVAVLVAGMFQLWQFAPTRQAAHEVESQAFNPKIRAALERDAAVPMLQNAVGRAAPPAPQTGMTIGPLKSSNSIPTFAETQRKLETASVAAVSASQASDLPVVNASAAAYALAQLYYLEDRPADARRSLDFIRDPSFAPASVHLQRIDLISDWLQHKGLAPVTSLPAALVLHNAATSRSISTVSGTLALATTLMLAIVLALSGLAYASKHRILALIAQRRAI